MKRLGKWGISLTLVLLLTILLTTPALATRTSTNYSLNGSEADNIVAVAVAQSKVTPKLTGSDFGFSDSWCGRFISWCAKKAGVSCVPNNITGGRSSIARITENNLGEFYCYTDAMVHSNDSYKNWSIYKYLSSHPTYKLNSTGRDHMHEVSREDFKPLKGDIVVFLSKNDHTHPQFTHVGLVREDYSGKGPVLTVEGNTTEKYTVACQERSIAKSAYMQIIGYVRPNYDTTSANKPSPTPSSSTSVKTDNYYTIQNLGSGKMLNVYGSGKADGTNVTVYSEDSTSGQDFKFIANGDGTYVVQPRCATSSALNVNGYSAGANSKVDIWTKSGHSTQSWIVEYNSSLNGYVIRSANNSSYVLAATGSKDSSDVRLAAYNASDKYQIWTSSAFPDNPNNSSSPEKPDRNVKLTLEKPVIEVSLGETATFNFTFTGDAGKVEYRILDKNICEYVSEGWKQSEHKGYITFSTLAEGTTNIPIFLYDKNENVADFYLATLTVKKAASPPQKATTLTFDPSSISLDLTNQKSREVTLTLDGDFSWGDKLYRSVSNPDVATVDWSSYEGGSVFRPVITAKATGDTTLTCFIEDNSTGKTLATAVLKITVIAATYTVQYDANGGKNAPASQTKTAQQELTLTANRPEREGFTFAGWSTSRNGSIQYQPGDSFTTDKDVTLYAVWEAENQVSLTLSNDSFTVKQGEQMTLNFTFTGNISSVNSEIKNPSICEYIDGEWKQSQHRGALTFRALSSGTTNIIIKLFDKTGKILDSQSASVIVETPQSNASIELSDSNINFSSPGETQGISVVTVPSGQSIIWSKEIIESLPIPDWNPSVCSINGSANNEGARIRATGPGIAAIIASMTYEGNTYTAKCFVTVPGVYVSVPDTVIVKDGNRKTMSIGSTEQFSVYTIPSNQTVRWNSSDPSVATVSNNGAVTAVGSGFAEIRATIDVNGTTYSDSCYVAVPENSNNTGVVYFDTLYPFASDRYTGNEGDSFIDVIGRRNGNVDVNGNSYEHGLTAWVARWNYTAESSWVWNQYNLGGNYKTLTGKVVLIKSYNESNFDTQLTITGDGTPLYSKRLTPDSLPTEEFQINVAGINTLKIELSDNTSVRGGTAFGLANLSLQ